MGVGREQVENIIETQRKFEENIAMEVKWILKSSEENHQYPLQQSNQQR